MSGKQQDGEGFLSRWSRRKRESHPADEQGEEAGLIAEEAVEQQEGTLSEGQESPAEDPELVANREAAEAVDLESLTYESDFTVFMKRGVPEALKNAALRKLWRSNPDLAVLDGLNDYDTDFRNAETAMDGFKSAWKVGRGYADKAEEVAAEMESRSARIAKELQAGQEEEIAEAQSDAVAGGDVSVELQEAEAEAVRAESEAEEQETEAATDETGGVEKAPRRRRMAFDVED